MKYVFDNSSISKLKHFSPEIFQTIWTELDRLVQTESIISTREVYRELQNGVPIVHTDSWIKKSKRIFLLPTQDELNFVEKILSTKDFASIIGVKQRLNGTPVADPFVIALAKVKGAVVVTEEKSKNGGVRIPNICDYFGIDCINLDKFMAQQGWKF